MGEVIPSIMFKAPTRQADQTGPRADAKQPAGDFAAQLREQLSATSVRRNPGPGSDAGKGGAAGESAAQPTDTKPKEKDEQGQTAGSGRETGEERLALQALLAGAQMPTATGAAATVATEAPTELTAVTAASAEPAASTGDAMAASAADSATVSYATVAAEAASANAAQPATPAVPASGKAAGSADATPAVPATPSANAAAAAFAAQSRATTAPAQPGHSQAQKAKEQAPSTATAEAPSAGTTATAPATAAATSGSSATPTATEAASDAGTAAQAAATAPTTEAVKADSGDGSAVSKTARGKADRLAPVNEADTAPADGTSEAPATGGNPVVTKARSDSAPEQPTRMRAAAAKAAAGADKPNSGRTTDATDALSVHPTAVTTGETAPVATARTIGVGRNPVDPAMAKSVIDQIVSRASVNREGELTELSLQLHPETLGRVNLRLSMTGGVLSAKVMVDNPAVKAALEANLADLRQNLADQGIALQGMSVALGGQGQQHEYRDYREAASQATEAPGRIRSAAVRQNAVATPVRSHGAGHRLDLIV